MEFAFPQYTLKKRRMGTQLQVWDPLRKKWLVMAGEEYVRQQFVQFLLQEHNIPAQRIGIEKGVSYHKMSKRIDLIVFDSAANPYILVECKAPDVALSEHTLLQVARYNVEFQAPYLVLTNGIDLQVYAKSLSGTYVRQSEGWFPN